MNLKLQPMPHQDMDTPRVLIALEQDILPYSAEIDGFTRTWQEFVPPSYDPAVPTPVVFTMHGAGGWDTNQKFAWALVARREGFIVVYPQSISNKVLWNCFGISDGKPGYPNELNYLDALFGIICGKYNVDRSRVYIHGQSMGDMMTTDYLMEHSELFAAACPSAGPTTPSFMYRADGSQRRIPPAGLPITRMHGTLDHLVFGMDRGASAKMTGEELCVNKMEAGVLPALQPWLDRNGCTDTPKISVRGIYNAVNYGGKDGCDTWFFTIEGGEHNPAPEYADLLWTYFLSGYRRVDGKIERCPNAPRWTEDSGAVAVTAGTDMAYVDNRLVKMSAPAQFCKGRLFPDGHVYVPADFIPQALGAELTLEDGGMSAEYTLGGRRLQCAAGVRACVLNDAIRFLPICLNIDGKLFVPIGEIARLLTGKRTLKRFGVEYITDSKGVLSYDVAYLIRQLLGADKKTGPLDWLEVEKKLTGRLMNEK